MEPRTAGLVVGADDRQKRVLLGLLPIEAMRDLLGGVQGVGEQARLLRLVDAQEEAAVVVGRVAHGQQQLRDGLVLWRGEGREGGE